MYNSAYKAFKSQVSILAFIWPLLAFAVAFFQIFATDLNMGNQKFPMQKNWVPQPYPCVCYAHNSKLAEEEGEGEEEEQNVILWF